MCGLNTIFLYLLLLKKIVKNMKKVIGIVLMVLGFGFIACENETKTADPSIIAMVNNEEFTTGVKFETWRPQYTDLRVANENILYLKAETDTTMFTLRVPYAFSNEEVDRTFAFGDVVPVDVSDLKTAFAQYIVYDKVTKAPIAIYKTAENITNTGEFKFADKDSQVPGTITAEFFANMKKDTMPGFYKLTTKQKEYYKNTLRDMKSFQDGVVYKMPVSAGN